MKTALIGAGFAGESHMKALRAIGLSADTVVTAHEESSRRFAARWNIPNYGTDIALACRPEIDAVHILTPTVSHAPAAQAVLSSGRHHILMEKPLAESAALAGELADAARRADVFTALTFNVRYQEAVREARRILSSGQLGAPVLIHGSYLQEFGALPAFFDWRYKPEISGRMHAVTEIGSHWIDTAFFLTGLRVQSVSALFHTVSPDRVVRDGMQYASDAPDHAGTPLHVSSEDSACIHFLYEGGIPGSVVLSEAAPGRGNRLSIEVTCEYGSLWWNSENNTHLFTARKGEGICEKIFSFGGGFSDTFADLVADFYQGIGSFEAGDRYGSGTGSVHGMGSSPSDSGSILADFSDGARVAAVCDAIYESAAHGFCWKDILPG